MKEIVPCLPRISSIPGPRGLQGASGSAGTSGTNATQPFTTTTSPFPMVAAGAQVTITVGATSWMAVGMPIFVETAGYFSVVTIISATTVRLQVQAAPGNAAATTVIASGKKVITGSVMSSDSTVTDGLTNRITALELTPGGNRSWYSTTAPSASTNALRVGDIWFDTDDGYKLYRWDGSTWAGVQRVLTQADFGTGIRPIVKVNSLPTSGYSDGDFVWLSTDGKLYRRVAGAWTKAISTGELTGKIDGSTFIVDGTIIAQKLGANSVTADKVGANQIITTAANIADATITDAKISNLAAGKITAGDIQSVNLGYAGALFHPSYISGVYAGRYFRATEFGTSYGDNKIFGSGSAYSFSHCTPVTGYGPGNAAWRLNGAPAFAPDASGSVRVQIQGRLIGYYGNILAYCRINNGAYQPLAGRYSQDGADAIIDCVRNLTGVTASSKIEIFVAPSNGNGDVTAGVTCRYEIDVLFYNF